MKNLLKIWPKIVETDKNYAPNTEAMDQWLIWAAHFYLKKNYSKQTILFISQEDFKEILIKHGSNSPWGAAMMKVLESKI